MRLFASILEPPRQKTIRTLETTACRQASVSRSAGRFCWSYRGGGPVLLSSSRDEGSQRAGVRQVRLLRTRPAHTYMSGMRLRPAGSGDRASGRATADESQAACHPVVDGAPANPGTDDVWATSPPSYFDNRSQNPPAAARADVVGRTGDLAIIDMHITLEGSIRETRLVRQTIPAQTMTIRLRNPFVPSL